MKISTFCIPCLFLYFTIVYSLPEPQITRVLQPLAAINIGDFVEEPSGLTYSNTTRHLYSICDKPKCHYIYEMHTNGTKVKEYFENGKIKQLLI